MFNRILMELYILVKTYEIKKNHEDVFPIASSKPNSTFYQSDCDPGQKLCKTILGTLVRRSSHRCHPP